MLMMSDADASQHQVTTHVSLLIIINSYAIHNIKKFLFCWYTNILVG